jgi:hypothetical protein
MIRVKNIDINIDSSIVHKEVSKCSTWQYYHWREGREKKMWFFIDLIFAVYDPLPDHKCGLNSEKLPICIHCHMRLILSGFFVFSQF